MPQGPSEADPAQGIRHGTDLVPGPSRALGRAKCQGMGRRTIGNFPAIVGIRPSPEVMGYRCPSWAPATGKVPAQEIARSHPCRRHGTCGPCRCRYRSRPRPPAVAERHLSQPHGRTMVWRLRHRRIRLRRGPVESDLHPCAGPGITQRTFQFRTGGGYVVQQPSVAKCGQDHDLLAMSAEGLHFGQRPAVNDMCTADRTPTALLTAAVNR